MPATQESIDIKKAMAYDLLDIIHQADGDETKTYTPKELEKIIKAYITELTQK